MAIMVAAGSDASFEFFAQLRLKIKKPALIAQVRAVKSKETLKYLKKLTVVSGFAV
jgi:hypothetical protein